MIARPSTEDMVNAALAYAARGWHVIPLHTTHDRRCTCRRGAKCNSPAKHPRTRHGLKDASTDAAVIRRWWKQWPTANIGILTGEVSGLVVLDIDPRHGGDAGLDQLEAVLGPLPETVEQITGGGGRHLLFRHPGQRVKNNQDGKLAPGLDVRGDGGYIVAPPSLHASGKRYSWELSHNPENTPLALLPEKLLHLLTENRRQQKATPDAEALRAGGLGESEIREELSRRERDEGPIPEGQRNSTLASLAGSMRRRRMSGDAIRAALLEENRRRCVPPLDDSEVARIARSVSKYPSGSSNKQDGRAIILDWMRETLRPMFRKEASVFSETHGRAVRQSEIVGAPTNVIIERLRNASDAPRDGDSIKRQRLPYFYATWARVAWGDLLAELPDEQAVGAESLSAAEGFKAALSRALHTLVPLGTTIAHEGTTKVERRSAVGWCEAFAQRGKWGRVRSLALWCRRAAEKAPASVALRAELFSQIGAVGPLRDLSPTRFAHLCAAYGVGKASKIYADGAEIRGVMLEAGFISSIAPPTWDRASRESNG